MLLKYDPGHRFTAEQAGSGFVAESSGVVNLARNSFETKHVFFSSSFS